jgi:hypothetical protein
MFLFYFQIDSSPLGGRGWFSYPGNLERSDGESPRRRSSYLS